jgi:hypothetical protein
MLKVIVTATKVVPCESPNALNDPKVRILGYIREDHRLLWCDLDHIQEFSNLGIKIATKLC